MISDKINSTRAYLGISPNLDAALKFFQSNNLNNQLPGKYEIDGEKIYAIIMDYKTKPISECKFEAHKKYIDIHVVINGGVEKIAWANIGDLKKVGPYNESKDVVLLEGTGDFIRLNSGKFALFFPHDAHMPGLNQDGLENIRKMVIKVAV